MPLTTSRQRRPFLWALFPAFVGSVIAGPSRDPTWPLIGAAAGLAVAIVTRDRA